ncbi:MtrAB system histidine kinase MtrB [Streptacidiphilus sp. PB12-B1b]|uniref:MtrAB system histidine kinase MtrB n=1 Tax=Streptacidiphilus sp. PB12-B1b TaxID=2705012 RepID=UPI001CDC0433
MHALLRMIHRRAARPFIRLTGLYRRSIQARVVAITLVLSLAVVLVLGVVVMSAVRNGLLEAKQDAAKIQAQSGFAVAQSQATAQDQSSSSTAARSADTTGGTGQPSSGSQVDIGTWLSTQVKLLANSGTGQYALVGMVPGTDTNVQANSADTPDSNNPREVGNVDPNASIPIAFQSQVANNAGTLQEQYTTIHDEGDSGSKAGLIVAEQLKVNGQSYQLYYLFPFTLEQNTLNLVTNTLAVAGVFVVILLGAISWLVVRQVVTPVRMAAEISERLADGRLEERMKVTGTDDIARLGESFNRMGSALQSQIRQLEELSRVQRRFVSDVSHELRTPLTTVRMAADLLYESREDFGDPAAERSAELLQNQLDRFESLLADLLEISRFDAGAAILDAEPADLRDVVSRVIEGAEPLARTKGSAVLVRGGDEPVVAEVDPRRIERILRNLVVNALEHGEGRDIEVRLAAGDGAVAVAVRDHGIGLKPGEASRVFNRFWRADPARARTTGGTGLGLSIALEDAALHGGWLHAWGEPGGGSQFRLTVPRNAGGEVHRSPIPLEPEDSRSNRGLDLAGMPYRRSARQTDAADLKEPLDAGVALGVGLGPGLGGVLGYGSVIPGMAGRMPLPPSNPADVRAASGYGATGAQVVVAKEGRDEGAAAQG